ncbi:Insulin-like growth factor-binding protein IGFBP [Trinorchestia longiramus]|nr:Insulin-like growth factor-binding protein IGFBP [Trinorchestia longiramus]
MAREVVWIVAVVAVTLLQGVSAQQPDIPCAECDKSKCPPKEECPEAEALDSCGCCVVCRRSLGQRCDLYPADGVKYGPCGDYLQCMPRQDILFGKEATCQCVQQKQVCGSDNVTYSSICHLLQEARILPNLTVQKQSPCLTKPVIKTPPQSSKRQLGGILVLDCEAVGYPVPSITWELYKPDGLSIKLPNDDSSIAVQIRGGPEQHMVTGWVQIMKVTPDNVGTYVCNAENSQGATKATAVITYVGRENEL